MKPRSFFKFVEIQTKVASVIPFIMGILYSLYRFGEIKILNVLLLFVSMIALDMATTAINNYLDYKNAVRKEGYNYETHNAMVRDNITDTKAKMIIFGLLGVSLLSGLVLFILTDWVILAIGAIGFIVGILYSFGPVPISRTPLGELFSGGVMGGLLFFASVYVNVYDYGLVISYVKSDVFHLHLMIDELLAIAVAAIPFVLMISGIMLANNICDIEDDIENKRHTLPYYLGRKYSLVSFALIYVLSYISVIAAVILGILPYSALLVLVTSVLVARNVKIFIHKQIKSETFILSVLNFVSFSALLILGMIFSLVLGIFAK